MTDHKSTKPTVDYLLEPTEYTIRLSSQNVCFGENITKVGIEEGGAGPYIKITQFESDDEEMTDKVITFDWKEFWLVANAVRRLEKRFGDKNYREDNIDLCH
jgi:hypothetical protein